MLTRNAVRALLEPFDLPLSDDSIDRLIMYLQLLLRWNQRINLTAIWTQEECVTRHFGESLLLSRHTRLRGRLLDIGSGGGFPGLALKLVAEDVEVVLLEPVAKKRAFLKEVLRACRFEKVKVLGARLEEYSPDSQSSKFDIITVRAVGGLELLVPVATGLLKPGGRLCLWVGRRQVDAIQAASPELKWLKPVVIPMSQERRIIQGIHEA